MKPQVNRVARDLAVEQSLDAAIEIDEAIRGLRQASPAFERLIFTLVGSPANEFNVVKKELLSDSRLASLYYRAAKSSGQELVDPFDRMILQSCEDIGEPGLRVDVVELCGLDQRVDSRRAPTAFVGACERPVTAADGDAAQRPLGGVIRHAQAAVVEEAGERGPAIEAVLDRLGDLVARGQLAALLAQPTLQCDDQRPAALVAHALALVRRRAIDLALDREQRIDALDRLDRDRRLVDPVEPGIGVRLHQAGIARQMLFGMLAAAVGRVEEDRRRRIEAAEGLIIADVGPESAGAALALGLHRHGGLV